MRLFFLEGWLDWGFLDVAPISSQVALYVYSHDGVEDYSDILHKDEEGKTTATRTLST